MDKWNRLKDKLIERLNTLLKREVPASDEIKEFHNGQETELENVLSDMNELDNEAEREG